MKEALEDRLGTRLAEDSVVIPWLVMHAARTMNRYLVGQDGKTAYRRWKGKDFKREVAEFGEAVLYLEAKTKGINKLDCRWKTGTWLGVLDSTGEALIGTRSVVVRARDIKRYSHPEDRWSKSSIADVVGTPFQRAVWRALLTIPAGQTRQYGELARQLNSQARAVGNAVGANRIALLVPCHRVVPRAGGPGGYHWGVARKKTLLAAEGIKDL